MVQFLRQEVPGWPRLSSNRPHLQQAECKSIPSLTYSCRLIEQAGRPNNMVNLRGYKVKDWARLNRPVDLRMAMLKTMTTQLFEHERILTTLSKAQALQRYADRIIAMARKGTPHDFNRAAGVVRTERELHKLFTTLALRYRDRPGGFTRVVRAGFREEDGVQMAYIELVDRAGELRPAARPVAEAAPLLPPAARAFLLQQAQLSRQQLQPSGSPAQLPA